MLSKRACSAARATGSRWTSPAPPPPSGRRFFSATRCARIKTTDMQEADIQSVKVDETRLMDTLHYTCRFGTGPTWKIKDRRAYHHFTQHTLHFPGQQPVRF